MSEFLKPMLAYDASKYKGDPYEGPLKVAEPKYDGHRIQIHQHGTTMELFTRRGRLMLPEGEDRGIAWIMGLRLPNGIYDGEIYLPGGTSSDVTHLTSVPDTGELHLALFDMLYTDDCAIVNEPLRFRRTLLQRALSILPVSENPRVLISPQTPDIRAALRAAMKQQEEGIIIKDALAPYRIGGRSWSWLKVKATTTVDYVIVDADGLPSQWTVRPGEVGKDGVLYPEGKRTSSWAAGYVNLRYGCYDQETNSLKVLGNSGITGPREEMQQHVGRVAEFKVYSVYPTGRARHMKFLEWRDDKAMAECQLKDILAAARDVVGG